MTETECLAKMIPPGKRRPGKYLGGIIQIHLTRACDRACYNCTQGSNLAGPLHVMTLEQFEQACLSLKGYWGVVGIFGGNPALHPDFKEICKILCKYFPKQQRGIWCNHPRSSGEVMRETFDPRHSNLNVHQSKEAAREFKRYWPECIIFGLEDDSRHPPVHGSMKDLPELSEEDRWDLISQCDINQHWSAMIGVFRGELRAWFCEVAGAQSILHQDDPNYPDTGIPLVLFPGVIQDAWWQVLMQDFKHQVRKHCHECLVPLRGFGELANAVDGIEQTTKTHESMYKPKSPGRKVQVITELVQLGTRLKSGTDYLGNAKRFNYENI